MTQAPDIRAGGLREALEACLQEMGWTNYTDDELRSLKTINAAVILRARAALSAPAPAAGREEIASVLARFFPGKQSLRNQAADAILALGVSLSPQENQAATPAQWRWRFASEHIVGRWSKWIMLETSEVEDFRKLQGDGIDHGRIQLEPLYATPPAAGDRAAAWQPIQTAPKNGTIILGWRTAEGVELVGEGYWDGGFEGAPDEPAVPAGWCIPSLNYFNVDKPTLWQPFPTLPRQENKGNASESSWSRIDTELSAYVQIVRSEAFEECAKIAERRPLTHAEWCITDPDAVRRNAADRIRSAALALPRAEREVEPRGRDFCTAQAVFDADRSSTE